MAYPHLHLGPSPPIDTLTVIVSYIVSVTVVLVQLVDVRPRLSCGYVLY